MNHTQEEIDLFITEYEPKSDDSIVDILKVRVDWAIKDQMKHMIEEEDFRDTDEVKRLILSGVEETIDGYTHE
jgi:hypothetical protein